MIKLFHIEILLPPDVKPGSFSSSSPLPRIDWKFIKHNAYINFCFLEITEECE